MHCTDKMKIEEDAQCEKIQSNQNTMHNEVVNWQNFLM